jgi:hypothetical protein
MKREQMQSLVDSWKKMTPDQQTDLAAYVNIQDETAAAFGIAFQRAKEDFKQARDTALRDTRVAAVKRRLMASNPVV